MTETVAVQIQHASECDTAPTDDTLRAWIATAVDATRHGEMTLRIVAEAESADLNKRYRGHEGPTNVLAFPAEAVRFAMEGDLSPIGDLVICAPLLAREAREQGKTPEAHWAHVVIHGALHLIGYDHETNQQAQLMEARERELMASFGYPDPY